MLFNLFITFWLSICCMSSNFSNDFRESSNSIEPVVTTPVVKNMGYINNGDDDIQLFLFDCDLQSSEFIINFVRGLEYRGLSQMGFYDYQTASYTFDNLGSYFLKVENGVVKGVATIGCDKIVLDKTSIVYGGDYRIFTYTLSFYRNNTETLNYIYNISVPLLEWNHAQVARYSATFSQRNVVDSSLTNLEWCYFEDSSYMTNTPFITYFLPYYIVDDISYTTGYTDGESVGYQNGFTAGYNDGVSVDATASTIFTGILDVALIPVNVFLTIFNFDVFGINIAGIVSALLTISVVVIIFRFIFGGKNDD